MQQLLAWIALLPSVLGFLARHSTLRPAARFSLEMAATGGLPDVSAMLLCLQATSKTTVINDPTAGMTPDEITNYVSNVGGGMCGAPEIVRTAIGVGLNLSLLVFGLFTVSYVVLGGLNFTLERDVDGLIEEIDGLTPQKKSFSDLASDAWNAPINTPPPPGSKGESGSGSGTSREQRRLQSRVKRGDK
jgi:hypothetical protein